MSELEALQKRDADSKPVREKIKTLEGNFIKKGRHRIKRAEKELKTVKEVKQRQCLESEIAAQEVFIEEAEKEVEGLRTQIVTSLDFKTARKALRRAQDMVDLEKKSRKKLVEALVSSFCAYDLDGSHRSKTLPKFTTTAILLGYIWRKYDSIRYLKGYFESMERLGALTCPASTAVALVEEHADLSTSMPAENNAALFCLPRRRNGWSAHDIATATAIVIGKPGVARRPPVVPFNYVSWANYSKFPDCGETALRNLINQMLYNPTTGLLDHQLLLELRHRHYPGMNQKLIDFYREHSNPQDVRDHAVARAWIVVVSKLNAGHKKGLAIRYRRERQQQNIASPLSNVLRVFNSLFGIEPLDDIKLQEVADHINEARGWNLKVETSGITESGFGIVDLTDGKVRYELQSHKPVHFGFVQAETLELDASGRHDFNVFRSLMRYSCGRPIAKRDDPAYFEQLALASLFVPYDLQRNRQGRFFRSCPPHYCVLFADLNGSTQQEAVTQWVRRQHRHDPYLVALVDRIHNYTEPVFCPRPLTIHLQRNEANVL
jgi:hypothetical protein